MLRPLH